MAAEVGSFAESIGSVTRHIPASDPGRLLQQRGNSGTFGRPPGSSAAIYRTTQPYNAVQEKIDSVGLVYSTRSC